MKIVLAAATAVVLSAAAGHHVAKQRPERATRPMSRVVTIKSLQFSPARIAANVGDTIVWRNEDVFSHTATASGVFDTREMKQNTTGKWVVKKRGVFNYACLFHATMKGVIEVK